mgnify:CR=1 FL=1
MSGSVIIDLNIIADVLEFFCNETQNNLGGITMRQIGTQSAKYFRRFVTAMLVFAMVITSLTEKSHHWGQSWRIRNPCAEKRTVKETEGFCDT